jgi:hypothetical protein
MIFSTLVYSLLQYISILKKTYITDKSVDCQNMEENIMD